MKLGIGIDTGGTYTDAVLFDLDEKKVLDSAKSLTTKQDLSVGIGNVLSCFETEKLSRISVISLSTTLATNACVENKGGRGKLLFIGVDEDIVKKNGKKYGFNDTNEIFFCKNESSYDGTYVETPDWNSLLEDMKNFLSDADGLAIVELNATHNSAVLEKQAREELLKEYDFPIICGYELTSKLNSIQRGSTALLNVKLIVIINDFIKSMKSALRNKSITTPLVVVRSDGSLMTEKRSKLRPVDTILSGPAASVLGGAALTDEKNSIIVDIGGTTTDISIVENYLPKTSGKGINIGKWRTHIDGVFVDTFGLGGDSAIRIVNGKIKLDSRRIMPISEAAQKWPSVIEDLYKLREEDPVYDCPIYEFLYVVKDIENKENYTPYQLNLYKALKEKPLSLKDAASAIGTSAFILKTEVLEKEGIIMRCGFTPTDVMHLKGDFNKHDNEGASLLAEYLTRCVSDDYTVERLCDDVYNKIKKKLYKNIVRILLQSTHKKWEESALDHQLNKLIEQAWENSTINNEVKMINSIFTSDYTLVGIGAPTHVFLPDVAKALKAKCCIPEYASVANALGAISSNVLVQSTIKINPSYSAGGIDNYILHGVDNNVKFDELEPAIEEAKKQAYKLAESEAIDRGVVGDVIVKVQVKKNMFGSAGESSLDLGTEVIATATGSIGYGKSDEE